MQPAAGSPPPFLLLLGVCLACLVFAGGVLAVTLSFVRRRTRVMDSAFAALGLVPSGAIPNVREYHGIVAGRAVDAIYNQRYRLLEVSVAARTATRGVVGREGGEALYPSVEPGLHIGGDEPLWMRAFVSEPFVRAALAWLVLDVSTSEVRTVRVRPGAVVLVRSGVDAASACANLSAVLKPQLAVAEAAERMPPPERAVGTSELEAAARRNPTRLALFIVVGLLGVLLLLGLVIVAVVLSAESSSPSRGRPGSGAATEPPRRPASH